MSAGQKRHSAEPIVALYFPAGHSVHVAAILVVSEPVNPLLQLQLYPGSALEVSEQVALDPQIPTVEHDNVLAVVSGMDFIVLVEISLPDVASIEVVSGLVVVPGPAPMLLAI